MADVERNPCAFYGCRAAGQSGIGRPNGHGRYCHGVVHKISGRFKRPGLAAETVSYCQTVMVQLLYSLLYLTGYDDIDLIRISAT